MAALEILSDKVLGGAGIAIGAVDFEGDNAAEVPERLLQKSQGRGAFLSEGRSALERSAAFHGLIVA